MILHQHQCQFALAAAQVGAVFQNPAKVAHAPKIVARSERLNKKGGFDLYSRLITGNQKWGFTP